MNIHLFYFQRIIFCCVLSLPSSLPAGLHTFALGSRPLSPPRISLCLQSGGVLPGAVQTCCRAVPFAAGVDRGGERVGFAFVCGHGRCWLGCWSGESPQMFVFSRIKADLCLFRPGCRSDGGSGVSLPYGNTLQEGFFAIQSSLICQDPIPTRKPAFPSSVC